MLVVIFVLFPLIFHYYFRFFFFVYDYTSLKFNDALEKVSQLKL